MRAVVLLGPIASERHFRQFELPGVNLFAGNELDPADQPDAALIFGGDGTVHRHLGGLALKQVPTLVVPLGSANDFARSIGVGTVAKALAAWKRFCAASDNVRAIDLGTIESFEEGRPGLELASQVQRQDAGLKPGSSTESEPDMPSDQPWRGESLESMHFVPDGPRHDLPQMGARIMQSQLRRASEAESELARTTFFACIAGTGLDAAVNRLTAQQPRWLRSHGGYVLGLLQVLRGFQPPRVTVAVEVNGNWQTRLDEPGFLIAAGNGPQYGHGMRLTHQGRMDDGLLDLCFVRPLSKLRLLHLFRLVYSGRHIGLKEVEYFQASRVRIETKPSTELFADGEYICPTPVELGVQPGALRIIVDE